jgi:hypothetical protein
MKPVYGSMPPLSQFPVLPSTVWFFEIILKRSNTPVTCRLFAEQSQETISSTLLSKVRDRPGMLRICLLGMIPTCPFLRQTIK